MRRHLTTILIALSVVSCHKKPLPPDSPEVYTDGIFVLNEGLYQQNNASVSWFSLTENKAYTQVFQQVNNRGLGDTANDFELYSIDGKVYIIIAVDVSSQIEIVEANSLKSVAQIPLFDGSIARSPRHITIVGHTAFVANFDGTVSVIDLETNAVANTIEVGANPDGITSYGGKVYVTNSGGLFAPDYDTIVSVIDVATQSVTKTLSSAINCSEIFVDDEGELYIISRGNYEDVNTKLIQIDPETEKKTVFDIPIRSMDGCGDCLYFYRDDQQAIYRMNLLSDEIDSEPLIQCEDYQTFYGLQLDVENELLYTVDTNGYVNSSTVRCYDLNGLLQFKFTAGLNATKLIYR